MITVQGGDDAMLKSWFEAATSSYPDLSRISSSAGFDTTSLHNNSIICGLVNLAKDSPSFRSVAAILWLISEFSNEATDENMTAFKSLTEKCSKTGLYLKESAAIITLCGKDFSIVENSLANLENIFAVVANFLLESDFTLQSTFDTSMKLIIKLDKALIEYRNDISYQVDIMNIKRLKSEVMKNLKSALCPSSFQQTIKDNNKKFCPGTRSWVFDELNEWLQLDAKDNRMFVIFADAGMGKTILCSALIQYCKTLQSVTVIGSILFDYSATDKSTALSAVKTLAYQIAQILPQLQQFIDDAIDSCEDLLSLKLTQMFSLLVKEPLEHYAKQNHTIPQNGMLIILDALDEVGVSYSVTRLALLQLISKEFQRLPSWIRIVVTSRPEVDISESLSIYTPHVLREYDERHISDLRLFLESKLVDVIDDSCSIMSAVDILIKKSEGKFIYLATLVDIPIFTSGNRYSIKQLLIDLPNGLDDCYFKYFQQTEKYFTDDDNHCHALNAPNVINSVDIFHKLLPLITYAIRPLFLCEIEQFLDMTSPDQKLKLREIVLKLSVVFPLRILEGKEQVMWFHKSVIDWLHDKTRCLKLYRDVTESNELFVCYLSKALSSDTYNELPTANYCTLYYVQHLIRCGQASNAYELFWQLHWLQKIGYVVGVRGLLEQINSLRAYFAPVNINYETNLRILYVAVKLSFSNYALVGSFVTNSLPFQLLCRLKNHRDISEVLSLLTQCDSWSDGSGRAVKPLVANFDVAGGPVVSTFFIRKLYFLCFNVIDDNTIACGVIDSFSIFGLHELQIYSLITGDVLKTLSGHSGDIIKILLLSDGRLVSTSRDNMAIVWDVNRSHAELCIRCENETVYTLLELSGNRLMGSTGHHISNSEKEQIFWQSGGVAYLLIWELSGGTLLQKVASPHQNFIRNIFVVNDDIVATTYRGMGVVTFWSCSAGEIVHTIHCRSDGPHMVYCALKDNKSLIIDTEGCRMWDILSQSFVVDILLPAMGDKLDFDKYQYLVLKDGIHIAVQSLYFGMIEIFSIFAREPVRIVKIPFKEGVRLFIHDHIFRDNVPDVVEMPNGYLACMSHYHDSVKIIDVSVHYLESSIDQRQSDDSSSILHFLLSGDLLYIRGDVAHVYNVMDGSVKTFNLQHNGSVCMVEVIDKIVFTGGSDGKIRCLNLCSGDCESVTSAHSGAVCALTLTRIDMVIASMSLDRHLSLWNICDVAMPVCICTFEETISTSGIYHLLTMDNGNIVGYGSSRTILVWQISVGMSHTISRQFALPVERNVSLLTNPASVRVLGPTIIAVFSQTHTIRIWDITTGQCVWILGEQILSDNLNVEKMFTSKYSFNKCFDDGILFREVMLDDSNNLLSLILQQNFDGETPSRVLFNANYEVLVLCFPEIITILSIRGYEAPRFVAFDSLEMVTAHCNSLYTTEYGYESIQSQIAENRKKHIVRLMRRQFPLTIIVSKHSHDLVQCEAKYYNRPQPRLHACVDCCNYFDDNDLVYTCMTCRDDYDDYDDYYCHARCVFSHCYPKIDLLSCLLDNSVLNAVDGSTLKLAELKGCYVCIVFATSSKVTFDSVRDLLALRYAEYISSDTCNKTPLRIIWVSKWYHDSIYYLSNDATENSTVSCYTELDMQDNIDCINRLLALFNPDQSLLYDLILFDDTGCLVGADCAKDLENMTFIEIFTEAKLNCEANSRSVDDTMLQLPDSYFTF